MTTQDQNNDRQAALLREVLYLFMTEVKGASESGEESQLERIMFVYKATQAVGSFGELMLERLFSSLPDGVSEALRLRLDSQVDPFTDIMRQALNDDAPEIVTSPSIP